jgi:transposase
MASSTPAHPDQEHTPNVVIGVDTHTVVHVAVALAPHGGRSGECRITATRCGYDQLIAGEAFSEGVASAAALS